MIELERTVGFLKDVFQVLSQEHDAQDFLVHHGVVVQRALRRGTLQPDGARQPRESLRIAAYRGIDPTIASKVKVRIGQGISGWVAHNRKPLFRAREERRQGGRVHRQDVYNCGFLPSPCRSSQERWWACST